MAVSTQDSSSSPSAFQSDTLGDTQIPMAKLKIQSNQKILLERNDSWVSQAQAQSFVNVPPEVIAQLRQLHTSLEPSKAKDIEARQSSAAEGAGHLTQDGLHQDRPPGRLSGDNCYEEETVATQLSWSSSQITPPRIQKATTSFSTSQPFGSQIPVRSPVRSMTGETAATQISWSPSPTPPRTQKPTTSCAISQASLSQLPEKPPLQPTLDASNIQKRPTFNEFPSSSPGVEDELEVVAPAAYTKEVLPLNKVPPLASGMDPTPPSAQVQVSSTIDHNSSVGAQPMQSKPNKPRQKVYKALNIESSQELVKPRLAQPTGATPWGLRVPAQPVTSLDLSIIPNSLYIIPSTNNEQHTQNPVDSHPPLSFVPIRETPRRKRTSLGIEESTKLTSPEYRPSSPVTLVTQPQTPFYLYSESYPSYTGSLDSFLVTCVYIHNRIQRRRELASYQYDDFIRAWYQDYVPYSKSCEAPLGAVPWYMENHGTLEFSKNIVTKENLKAILNFYPIELASAHEKLRAAQQATELAQETATRLQAKLACSPHPRSQLSPIQASSVMLPVVEVDNGSDKMVGALEMSLASAMEQVQCWKPQKLQEVIHREASERGLNSQ
ncbi:uncharacterized protein BCR38DRAFT_490174 [Pseudomassariella vexata]|uniref:Uncharacterized protein n=1 Tax=Pseudomassariella vexata TaxID=1141098 RepID=A0A1Y2DDC0_9PEZI|nr:uncharacterized protein BCR38DRAFT_490174 [Pseudomassariella vexata]ORY57197.1 hypothetical protein BCR38DRAFT_490174 [Pseudomassariella vexata]